MGDYWGGGIGEVVAVAGEVESEVCLRLGGGEDRWVRKVEVRVVGWLRFAGRLGRWFGFATSRSSEDRYEVLERWERPK